MAKCKRCGKSFYKEDARYEFEDETRLNYDNLVLRLCGDCAIEVIEDEIEGEYFETCEECGTRFDFIEEQSKFRSYHEGTGYLRDYWDEKILCAECAADEASNRYQKYRNEYPEEFDDYVHDDDDDDESLSVDEAALIWASHGKDEDYMYGYSEEELEDAL